MKKENIIFLFLSIFTVACISLIGIAISMASVGLAIGGIIGSIVAMGIGFSYKKKLRESENM